MKSCILDTIIVKYPTLVFLQLATLSSHSLSTASDGAFEEAAAAVTGGHPVVFSRGLVAADSTG